jgi:hypothetical protein
MGGEQTPALVLDVVLEHLDLAGDASSWDWLGVETRAYGATCIGDLLGLKEARAAPAPARERNRGCHVPMRPSILPRGAEGTAGEPALLRRCRLSLYTCVVNTRSMVLWIATATSN